MAEELRDLILAADTSLAEISARTQQIYEAAVQKFGGCGNFNTISARDLQLLFDLYDKLFFYGHCARAVHTTESRLLFRVSRRMTSAGGRTTRVQRGVERPGHNTVYEIAVSSVLLFQTFRDESRPIDVSGVRCRDRLEALQRIFEHELVHLLEHLVWNGSSCSAPRFRSIANRVFAHTATMHRLITPQERALTKFGIRPGIQVAFDFQGERHVGVVNRIGKRATILVEHEQGATYSDGRCYQKYYVPLSLLRVCGGLERR
jgi:hypothetical protein